MCVNTICVCIADENTSIFIWDLVQNMKRINKTFILTIIFAGIFLTMPKQAGASSKNAADIAKLKKIVNQQIKKGARLSKDVIYDRNYTWDKKETLNQSHGKNVNLQAV